MSDCPNPPHYSVRVERDGDTLVDALVEIDGKTIQLAGRFGIKRERETALRETAETDGLPVFLGLGLGAGLDAVLEGRSGPVAVVDKEKALTETLGVWKKYKDKDNVLLLDEASPDTVMKALKEWRSKNGGAPFVPVAHPVHMRLDPSFYGTLRDSLAQSEEFDFWSKVNYPKFQNEVPRVLLLTSKYFLMGELIGACSRLGVPHHFVSLSGDSVGSTDFIRDILTAVAEFKPDFVLTINHLGVDREGVLMELLEKMNLPLASWFVDNPHLILYLYEKLSGPLTTLFTWDADNVDSLKKRGFEKVFYLPLAVDVTRFRPPRSIPAEHPWKSRVSFVGTSMVLKVRKRRDACEYPEALLEAYPELAAAFGESQERSVGDFIQRTRPDLAPLFESLPDNETRLSYETLITWEATRIYRKACVEGILPFRPIIVGDEGWLRTYPDEGKTWRRHKELNYYEDLPRFYPLSEVNFNCTSKQMKGAVNQRVFDVPASGGFLISDHRDQMERLFEPGKEIIVYDSPEDVTELTTRMLDDPAKRGQIVEAALKRIMAEHTYDQRVRELLKMMRAAHT
jgi:spore maturation protein CgeB